ncbi:MAG: sigma-70 family RNA polymerase sigma factor [Phycisphaerales bacterium]|nr:sigma-70 family RNA polymerase sigma factor [Phycisphaerales bacterium]
MNRFGDEAGPSDAELVERTRTGDASAFDELVARYQDRVYNLCYRLCPNHADAADLTQTAFLKALESLSRFESRANFFTWLYRIAANESLSLRRQRRRRPTISLDSGDGERAPHESIADDAPVGSERLDQAVMLRRLEAALEKLDEEFRMAVVLRDIEDMDYAEIADVLGVPVGTVKSRIHRGRMMLRTILSAPVRASGG